MLDRSAAELPNRGRLMTRYKFNQVLASFLLKLPRKAGSILRNTIKARLLAASFASCGSGFRIGAGCEILGNENVSVGNNVNLGSHTCILAAKARLILGDDVIFGPHVTVVTGDHRTDILDRPMASVCDDEKLPENDQDVVLAGDNWVGSNAVILKGVTIGRGAVVASGAIVNKDVQDYSIVGGGARQGYREPIATKRILRAAL